MLFFTLICEVTSSPGSVTRFRNVGARVRLIPDGGVSLGTRGVGEGVNLASSSSDFEADFGSVDFED